MTDRLFSPDYAQPVDVTTCVDRMPGTADAPCMCGLTECQWPFRAECWPDRNPQPEPEKEASR